MLIDINNYDKRKSWYICDRCGERLTGVSRRLVSINNKKRFDLCAQCCRIVERFVERGITNERKRS